MHLLSVRRYLISFHGSEAIYPKENADCEVADRNRGKSHHCCGTIGGDADWKIVMTLVCAVIGHHCSYSFC